MTDALFRLFDRGLHIEKLHVVSYSLGSHLAGMVGRNVQRMSHGKRKLKRITCLDASFPGFYPPLKLYESINKDDAEFVSFYLLKSIVENQFF